MSCKQHASRSKGRAAAETTCGEEGTIGSIAARDVNQECNAQLQVTEDACADRHRRQIELTNLTLGDWTWTAPPIAAAGQPPLAIAKPAALTNGRPPDDTRFVRVAVHLASAISKGVVDGARLEADPTNYHILRIPGAGVVRGVCSGGASLAMHRTKTGLRSSAQFQENK